MVLVLELVGAFLLVLASAGLPWWSQDSLIFVVLNLVGAGLLAVAAVLAGALGFVFLFVVWFLVSVRSLLAILRRSPEIAALERQRDLDP